MAEQTTPGIDGRFAWHLSTISLTLLVIAALIMSLLFIGCFALPGDLTQLSTHLPESIVERYTTAALLVLMTVALVVTWDRAQAITEKRRRTHHERTAQRHLAEPLGAGRPRF